MTQEIKETCLVDFEIICPGVGEVKVNDMPYAVAFKMCEDIVAAHHDNVVLQEMWSSVKEGFGFRSISRIYGTGTRASFDTFAKPEVVKKKDPNDKHTCESRKAQGRYNGTDEDTWDVRGNDRCCSYCGSLHPDELIELIKTHGTSVIGSYDKSYKFYLERKNIPNASFGTIKFYKWHLNESHISEINKLIKKI